MRFYRTRPKLPPAASDLKPQIAIIAAHANDSGGLRQLRLAQANAISDVSMLGKELPAHYRCGHGDIEVNGRAVKASFEASVRPI